MISEIVVIGYPGVCGGADTELYDQIKLWSKIGVKTIIIPTIKPVYNIDLSGLNITIEEIRRYEACRGKHVIAFCNPYFLKDIEIIRKYAKTVSWVNCMCFNFKEEIEAHKNGYIDFFLYQTKHQYYKCGGNLLNANNNYNAVHIQPYFDLTNFPFIDNRCNNTFGRISRAAQDKFSDYQFNIFRLSPITLLDYKGIVLGWSDELECQLNDEDQKYLKKRNYVTFYKENEITQQEFYKRCDIICMSTNTFENFPRVGMEAMASGSVLIVDNRGGWKLQVEHGITGYLCNNETDFLQYLENLVCRPDIRSQFAINARHKLETDFSFEKSVSSWISFFKDLTC